MKYLLAILSGFIMSHSSAQIMPVENDSLNFTIAGFSVPANKAYTSYKFEIADGRYTGETEFSKNIILKAEGKDARTVIELPAFGKEYSWRCVYTDAKKKITKSNINHFKTLYVPYVDIGKYRLHIINAATAYQQMYVLTDNTAVMYDMYGKPIWFLPDLKGIMERDKGKLRDLKPTADGTFTILHDNGAFEFDYHGRLMWKAPNDGKVSGDSAERYHHEFTKLSNGNYMIAGNERIIKAMPSDWDTATFTKTGKYIIKDGKYFASIDCGTLIEYDSKGKIVWYWKSSEYFTDVDYFSNIMPDGSPNTNTHMNSFYFDEKNGIVYAGFRNISRVVKIRYADKHVIRSYGPQLERKERPVDNRRDDREERPNDIKSSNRKIPPAVFKAQHCVRVTDDGTLYMFNNNTIRSNQVTSYVSVFKEPEAVFQPLIKVWDYACNMDTFANPGSASGGSVYMLPGSSILASMGIEGRIFIVDKDKNLSWNAIPESKNYLDAWTLQPQYRASYIYNKTELEKFIFHRQ